MRARISATLFGLVLGGMALATALPAAAATDIRIGDRDIAFGYSDGYWDREHGWHRWRDQREAAEWRREHREHYYTWKHDRDRDKMGWREEHWWGRD